MFRVVLQQSLQFFDDFVFCGSVVGRYFGNGAALELRHFLNEQLDFGVEIRLDGDRGSGFEPRRRLQLDECVEEKQKRFRIDDVKEERRENVEAAKTEFQFGFFEELLLFDVGFLGGGGLALGIEFL